MIWSQFKQKISIFMLDILIFLCWCAGFKRGTARGFLIISMTFFEFSKTWSQIPWLFQAWKKHEIPSPFQVFHDWVHPDFKTATSGVVKGQGNEGIQLTITYYIRSYLDTFPPFVFLWKFATAPRTCNTKTDHIKLFSPQHSPTLSKTLKQPS